MCRAARTALLGCCLAWLAALAVGCEADSPGPAGAGDATGRTDAPLTGTDVAGGAADVAAGSDVVAAADVPAAADRAGEIGKSRVRAARAGA
jgi:hypothetical protein